MRAVLLRSAIIGLLVIATASVSACSGVSSVVAGNGTPPQNKQTLYVITRSHTAIVTGGSNLPLAEASQPCGVSEAVVGGGYSVEQFSSPTGVLPTESHPTANGDGWVVGFIPPLSESETISFTVYAQCLVGGAVRISVQSVSHDFPYSAQPTLPVTVVAQCPTGSTDVGGGYAMRPGIVVDNNLYALGGGNFLSTANQDLIAGATAYVICYAATVTMSLIRARGTAQGSKIVNVIGSNGQSESETYYYVNFYNSCRPGASMTTGGYAEPTNFGAISTDINAPVLQGTRWEWEIDLISRTPISIGDLPYAEFACAAF